MTTSASAVSASLRRLGFHPVAASDRSREGLRVSSSVVGVTVTADLDTPAEAARLSASAFDALADRYTLERFSPTSFRVAR